MATILLSDLVDEMERSLRSNAYAKRTIENQVGASRRFLTHVGNIYAHNVTSKHVDSYFAKRQAQDLAAGSLNNELNGLRALFRYATHRNYVRSDPTAHRRRFREIKRNRVRIPAHEFGRLLDCATNPVDRIVVALGLYLFLRKSEIVLLRIEDVNLDAGEVYVKIPKSSKSDPMPVCTELDVELRRFLTWYASQVERPLRSDDFLVPARTAPSIVDQQIRVDMQQVRPDRPMSKPHRAAQRVLEAFGVDLRGDDGRSNMEGVHTLRRSGARALFDAKVTSGYDGALRLVQAMLHHSQSATTEIYLGIDLDKKKRDDVIKGMTMFPVDNTNVVQIGGIREAEDHANGVRHVSA